MMNEEEKKIEEGEQEEVEEIPQLMRDIAPPSEPAPTSSGPGTMENRAGELRTLMLDAKAGRIAALEKEYEKEAGKENPTVPDTSDVGKSKESGVEEEEEESSESSFQIHLRTRRKLRKKTRQFRYLRASDVSH